MSIIAPVSTPTAAKRSTAYLDGVRGLAAFLVFIQHYIAAFDLGAHEHGFGEDGKYYYIASFPFLRIFFGGGDAAVSIFFVLSGFVLSQSPLKTMLVEKLRGAARLSLTSSVVRRPVRLYLPPLAVALVTACLMHLPGGPYHISWSSPQDSLLAELSNYVVASIRFFNPFQGHDNYIWYQYGMPMWTIPIELKGSMLVYGLLAIGTLFPNRTKLLMIGDAMLFLTLLISGRWTMACFVAGLLLSYNDVLMLDSSTVERLTKRGRKVLYSSMFVLGYWLLCEPNSFDHPESAANTPGWKTLYLVTPPGYHSKKFYRFWHTLGAILFIESVLHLSWLQRFFSTRPLQYLGKVSFMLYLTHLPLLYTAGEIVRCGLGVCLPPAEGEAPWYHDRFWVPDIGPPGFNLRWLLGVSVMAMICLPVAHYTTILVEEPSVRIGKKLTTRLGLEKRWQRIMLPEMTETRHEQTEPLI